MKRLWLVAGLVGGLVWSSGACAASKVPLYVPAPAWITPAGPDNATPAPDGAPYLILASENQVRFGTDADEFYTRLKVKVLTPEGLAAGNITQSWNPSSDDLRVHALRILRDGQVIDVLKSQKFAILQREENLESDMLDGALTAALQIDGLQVGDVIETVSSYRRKPFGGRSEGAAVFPSTGAVGTWALRASWPNSRPVNWRASRDLGALKPAEAGDGLVLAHAMENPTAAQTIDYAPARYNRVRQIEFSSYRSWAEVAEVMAPHYVRAAALAPDSPLKTEARKIAAASADPAARVAAALRLVQDQIRYVYVGLDEGAYIPATADETWRRRFGDCKGKTVVLLALLAELGIKAEPALVSSDDGDGMDQRLPRLGVFDHVLVRTELDGETYWLDGTRTGDRELAAIRNDDLHWALPVRAGATLEKVEPRIAPLPDTSLLIEIDASKGLDVEAPIMGEYLLRGDTAVALRTAFGTMSPADVRTKLKNSWRELASWIEADEVAWKFDDARRQLRMTMKGKGKPDWYDEDGERLFEIDYGQLPGIGDYTRPADQDQSAPFAVNFPGHARWVTTMRLPADTGRVYSVRGEDVEETVGGYAHWRRAEVRDNELIMVRSLRSLGPEISASAAKAAQERSKSWDSEPLWLVAAEPGRRKPDYRRAEREAGKDPDKLLRLGYDYVDRGELQRAVTVFDRALAARPGDPLALNGKAAALFKGKEPRKALAAIDPPLRARPDPLLYMMRSAILGETGSRAEAVAALQEATRRFPDNAELHAHLAYAHADAEDAPGALAASEAAIRLGGDKAALRRLRAGLLAEDKPAEALREMTAAIHLSPDEALNWVERAALHMRAERYERALADLEEAQRIDPADSETYDDQAAVFERMQRRGDALAALTRAVQRTGGSAWALNNRCWQRALWGEQLEEAEADCAAALIRAPQDADIIDSHAFVAFRRGQYDEALRRYDRALAIAPRQAESLYGRGLARLKRGDEAGGRADIAAAKGVWAEVGEELGRYGVTP